MLPQKLRIGGEESIKHGQGFFWGNNLNDYEAGLRSQLQPKSPWNKRRTRRGRAQEGVSEKEENKTS